MAWTNHTFLSNAYVHISSVSDEMVEKWVDEEKIAMLGEKIQRTSKPVDIAFQYRICNSLYSHNRMGDYLLSAVRDLLSCKV